MKRSEILDEITFILDKEVGDLDFPSISEVILKMLEELGMKPKGYYGLMASGKKYNKDTDQGRDVEYFHYWEPEDE